MLYELFIPILEITGFTLTQILLLIIIIKIFLGD